MTLWEDIEDFAAPQHWVLSRRQLGRLGVEEWRIRNQLRAGRWAAHGDHVIALHTGPLDAGALMWVAVLEAGTRSALDGANALIAAGLKGFAVDHIRVSVPRGTKPVAAYGVVVRQTRRLRVDDILTVGLPRVRPAVAAVRAGLWAQSNRQAALLISMTVQQRIARAESIGVALLDVKRDKRRRFLELTLLDVLGGAESMGELDFARQCRRRGLPKPDQQQLCHGKTGRYYLDVRWSQFHTVVEIDGIHHAFAQSVVPDALRQNEVSLTGDTVLRLPLLALRVAPEAFFDQIGRALATHGWHQRLTS